jgi:UDP-N-acetylmuramyl tripeptide synthase
MGTALSRRCNAPRRRRRYSEQERPADFTWRLATGARRSYRFGKSRRSRKRPPSHDLALVGITGTHGKTTTTYLCFALAQAAGVKPAMLTTVEYRIGDKSEPAVRTTPEAVRYQ